MNFKKYHESKNLFDKTTITTGKWKSTSGDTTVSVGSYSDYIAVDSDTDYYVTAIVSQSSFYSGVSYDSAKTPISNIELPRNATSGVIHTPANCAYIILNISTNKANEVMLNLGSTPQPYEPYDTEVWHDIPHYIHNTSTDTITTLPAVLYPNAVTATVGLKGQMEQSGTPSPTTPIQPQECGERTGNLSDLYNVDKTQIGLRVTTGNNMRVVVNGTKGSGNNVISIKTPNIVLPAGTYTLTIKMVGGEIKNTDEGAFFGINQSTYAHRTTPNVKNIGDVGKRTFTISTDTVISSFDITPSYSNTGAIWENAEFECMLYSGSDSIDYEPYGVKIPILSGGVTTPVYLGEVQTTRKIRKYEFTGEENISDIGDYYNTNVSVLSVAWSTTTSTTGGFQINNGGNRIWAIKSHFSSYATAADFKIYLAQQYAAGTPVVVYYVLATPTTGIVNEPLRKIGDYTDTVSDITIPTITGKDTVDVLTTLKPSEVELTYTGWHDASVKEWDGSEWQ